MQPLTSEQRNSLYLQAATRTGIHKPILAALHSVQNQPSLADGETGLGISPIHRVTLAQVSTFPDQVQIAANTIRSLTQRLIADDRSPSALWDAESGYTSDFLRTIASGYAPLATERMAAQLESCSESALQQAYLEDVATDLKAAGVTQLNFLNQALLAFVQSLPRYFLGLTHQRSALLELVRLWQQVDTQAEALENLLPSDEATPELIDPTLLQFVQGVPTYYQGYPPQRSALLRLVQLWRQIESPEAAIASLTVSTSSEPTPTLLDAALIGLLHRISQTYEGRSDQRNALVEGFQQWQQLPTRSDTLLALGVNPEIFATTPQSDDLKNTALLVDRSLLGVVQRMPIDYTGSDLQREALLKLTQRWHGLSTREQTIQSLLDDLNRSAQARRDSPDAPPKPLVVSLPSRPDRWTPENLQMFAPILASGSFIWADATAGGKYHPLNQATVDAIVRLATQLQTARDRLDRPLSPTQWYCPPNSAVTPAAAVPNRFALGDAIELYCDGLTGAQLYWFLDPWWSGGLGHNRQFPYLIYLDARDDRVRWFY